MNVRLLNRVVKQYYHNLGFRITVSDINGGDCMIWAYLAHTMFNAELWSTKCCGSHAFVKFEGRFYDAQTPYGVEDWRKLGGCRDWRPSILTKPFNNAFRLSAIRFKDFWNDFPTYTIVRDLITIFHECS